MTTANLLLGQLELKAIEIGESCSLLFRSQFLSPCCLFPLFKDLSLLKGLLNWTTLGRGSYCDLEVSERQVLEVKGLAADIGTGPINQCLLRKISIKFHFTLLTPRSDQFVASPHYIYTLSSRQARRMKITN